MKTITAVLLLITSVDPPPLLPIYIQAPSLPESTHSPREERERNKASFPIPICRESHMAGSGACMVVVLVVAMAVLLAPARRAAAMTCSDVYGDLLPCVEYVQAGGAVAPECCSGVRSLLAAARTADDRRTACRCLKTVAAKFSGYVSRANSIPGKCGVSIPFKLSPSMDCSKIH
ncbi:non-specific lipid-transfer protein 1-like [Phoenix dactylifera]|uniref:Non-specific lipid-transfer protein n=1 Tax=Phoenix dactylifera TaxID=42345 RepID=A0A8B7C5K1_PHODC|nr:non-specific lipid-transfer protein 1-like [Phoenix dactylifera]